MNVEEKSSRQIGGEIEREKEEIYKDLMCWCDGRGND